jgi:hypothetical protein
MATGTTAQRGGRHTARLHSVLIVATRLTVEMSAALAVNRLALPEMAMTSEAAAVLASVLAGELAARAARRLRP